MYQMYRESLGGISAVSQLALMSARCLGRRDLPTLYLPYSHTTPTTAYYPYHRPLLATTPTTPTYYPYYPYCPTAPTAPTTPYYPSTTPRTGYRLLPLPQPTTPYIQYPYYPCYLLLLLLPLLPLLPQREVQHVSCMYGSSHGQDQPES